MHKTVSALLALLSFLFMQMYSCPQPGNTASQEKNVTNPTENTTQPAEHLTQPLWKELRESDYSKVNFQRQHFRKFKMYSLDSAQMRSLLIKAPKEKPSLGNSEKISIEIPNPEGKLLSFLVYETSTMDSGLAARYPELKTYGGALANDNSTSIRLDFNPNGFHAYVRSTSGEWFIQPPVQGISHQYLICFYKQDMIAPREPFELSDSMRNK
jgi:hypothetical protein